MFVTNDNSKNKLIAKIACIGPGGSGKTRMINSIANLFAERELYPWNEEKNLAGTIAVTPYTLTIPEGKVIVADNPGQDSFETIRKIIANQGDVYQGYIVVLDALGWDFKDIAISQLKSMSEGDGHQDFVPIALIVNKKDLLEIILKSDKIKELSLVIAKAANKISSNKVIKFQDRAYNRSGSFTVNLQDEALVPFTVMEQSIVNAIELWLKESNIESFTLMNIRLTARSFLLGYCKAMADTVDLSKWPMFKSFEDPNLVNRLNYHRPTAFETGSGWERLSGKDSQGKLNIEEPPILHNTIDEKSVEIILRNYVFVTDEKFQEFINELNTFGQIYKWHVTSVIFTNSVNKKGLSQIKDCLVGLFRTLDLLSITKSSQKPKKMKDVSNQELSSLGLDDF